MSIKRFLCFFILLVCLSFAVSAVPKTDGNIGPMEYNETFKLLQESKYESNNRLKYAYLHWAVSPENQSVYLGLQYKCRDYMLEEDKSAVRVFINRELIGTIYADNTVEGVDHDRFELDAVFDDGRQTIDHDANCEVRVGIKFWEDSEIVAGFQVLDFSGNPSNYYAHLVYSPYTTTTQKSETTTKPPKTTAESTASTTIAPTTQATTRAPRTTTPVITASPNRETTATQAARVLPSTTAAEAAVTTKTVKEKTTKLKTTKAKKTKQTTEASAPERTGTTQPLTTEPAATAAAEILTTAPTTATQAAVAVSGAQMYREINKVKIVGIVLVVVILTAAILSAVFLGMRRKDEPGAPHTPQEEYDDFG